MISQIADTRQLPKFSAGEAARKKWAKPLPEEGMTVDAFNEACGGVFEHVADIVLDNSDRRQTTIEAQLPRVPGAQERYTADTEKIYLFARDDEIMKIGGTRTGMKKRFGSYLCGHCVPERVKRNGDAFPGKMSVTNAHLYHTIETDLLAGNSWKIYTWNIPETTIEVEILGEKTTVVAQTYHAYESRCMRKFNEMTGHIPHLCDNSDPSYR